MKTETQSRLLSAIKSHGSKKKHVTFFISMDIKAALASWCRAHGVSESGVIEEMIRLVILDEPEAEK